MYGHVCETGGTREVLPPRILERVTFKDLLQRIKFVSSWTCHELSNGRQNIKRTRGKDDAAQGVCYRKTDET